MHKIFGYLLICVGVLFIFFSWLCMYKVFVDRHPTAPVVQFADMNLQTQYGLITVPMQNINTIANLGLFALFMLFVLSAGGKLAGLGVNLLKNERIYEGLLALQSKSNAPSAESLKKLWTFILF